MNKIMKEMADNLKYGTLGKHFPKYRKAMDVTYTILGMGTLVYLSYKAGIAIAEYLLTEKKASR
jgi:hypothetical protein